MGKQIGDEALSELVANVGPNLPQLESELGKLALYVGDRVDITINDVTAIVTRNKHARAFALADALGDRDLPRLLRCLDEELWSIKTDPKKSVIGLLYGLIAKVRVLILLKELLNSGLLKAEGDFNRFKSQLERVPADALPEDKRFNPLTMNPYVVFKALPQTANYSTGELVRALELLFRSNQQLFSRTDDRVVLQRALTEIVGTAVNVGEQECPRNPPTRMSAPRR
jgi:DNA polymerase-3 subunit delta